MQVKTIVTQLAELQVLDKIADGVYPDLYYHVRYAVEELDPALKDSPLKGLSERFRAEEKGPAHKKPRFI